MMKLKQLTIATLMVAAMVCSVEVMAGSCTKQGSSTSIDWIKKRYKNCTNCGTQKDKNGKTVYYCYCGDGCGASNKPNSNANQASANPVGKKSGGCTKQGSSTGVAAIVAKYKNCYNCGTQQNNGKTVYYCYCGDGCTGTPASSFRERSPSFSSSSGSLTSSGNRDNSSSSSASVKLVDKSNGAKCTYINNYMAYSDNKPGTYYRYACPKGYYCDGLTKSKSNIGCTNGGVSSTSGSSGSVKLVDKSNGSKCTYINNYMAYSDNKAGTYYRYACPKGYYCDGLIKSKSNNIGWCSN